MFGKAYNDIVCHTCKVYVDTGSKYSESFSKIHALCNRELMANSPPSNLPTSPRWASTAYKDLDTMTDVGRALVQECIIERLKKQVRFIEEGGDE